MKRFALPFLIFLAASCATASTVDARRALDNTVQLITDDGRIFCSGFIMKGAVITAAHCVEGDIYVKVRTFSGVERLLKVVRYNETQDVAALIPAGGGLFGEGIPLAKRAPGYGDEVLVLGHSKGDDFPYSLTRGVVSHPRRVGGPYDGMVWLQHDAGSIGGNSGGPVLNSDGEIVGITSFGVLVNAICAFDCRGLIYTRTHISGAAHFESVAALLASR